MTKARARRIGYLRNVSAMRQQQRRYIHITWRDRLWVWTDLMRHDPWHRFGIATGIMTIVPFLIIAVMMTNGFSKLATILTVLPLSLAILWLLSRG